MEDNTKHQTNDDRMMDELFRENLSDHKIEPSSGVWKSISRKLLWKEISHFNFTNLSRLSWIGGIAVAVLITVTFYFLFKPGDSNYAISSAKKIPVIPAASIPDLSTSSSVLPAPPAAAVSRFSPSSLIVSKVSPIKAINSTIASASITSHDPFRISESSPEESLVTEYVESISTETDPFVFMNFKPTPDLTPDALTNTLRFTGPGNIIHLILKDKIPTSNFFSVSLSVLPEINFYKTPSSYSEMNYWMNLGASYNISRFSIGTGISLGCIYDEGKYRIEYKSKDSIGYYESVVGFTVNPQNPTEIIYTTELTNVYDSIQHIVDDQTRNRYTYLQVPLLLGYRFVETQHLGITLQAGPAVSFLIGRKEAKPYVDYPNARIIRIENNTSKRISTSWQLWLSLRIDYRINKTISIFAEPSYKYTIKAFEISGEGSFSNANSIGLGIGMQFYFGKNN